MRILSLRWTSGERTLFLFNGVYDVPRILLAIKAIMLGLAHVASISCDVMFFSEPRSQGSSPPSPQRRKCPGNKVVFLGPQELVFWCSKIT